MPRRTGGCCKVSEWDFERKRQNGIYAGAGMLLTIFVSVQFRRSSKYKEPFARTSVDSEHGMLSKLSKSCLKKMTCEIPPASPPLVELLRSEPYAVFFFLPSLPPFVPSSFSATVCLLAPQIAMLFGCQTINQLADGCHITASASYPTHDELFFFTFLSRFHPCLAGNCGIFYWYPAV